MTAHSSTLRIGLDGPPSNLDVVLARIGRASTPPVKESPFGITLGKLIGLPGTVDAPAAVVVAPPSTREALSEVCRVITGVPGVLREQVAIDGVTALVIDWAAFHGGPWIGANTHGARALSHEIFDAGRLMRASGRSVYGLTGGAMESSTDAYLRSTCTVDLRDVDPFDLEEQAPQSTLWHTLNEVMDARLRRTSTPLPPSTTPAKESSL